MLVTDQYAGYRFIDGKPASAVLGPMYCAMVSDCRQRRKVNQPIGARLVLLANSVFRGSDMAMNKACGRMPEQYQRRLGAMSAKLAKRAGASSLVAAASATWRSLSAARDDEMLWRFHRRRDSLDQ